MHSLFILFCLFEGIYGQCCSNCTLPQQKYYSVDHGFGHAPFCGETCLDPSKFNIYHVFERNLTKSNETHPCARQYAPDGHKYSTFNSTVTHGAFGLKITLDLYSPSK